MREINNTARHQKTNKAEYNWKCKFGKIYFFKLAGPLDLLLICCLSWSKSVANVSLFITQLLSQNWLQLPMFGHFKQKYLGRLGLNILVLFMAWNVDWSINIGLKICLIHLTWQQSFVLYLSSFGSNKLQILCFICLMIVYDFGKSYSSS